MSEQDRKSRKPARGGGSGARSTGASATRSARREPASRSSAGSERAANQSAAKRRTDAAQGASKQRPSKRSGPLGAADAAAQGREGKARGESAAGADAAAPVGIDPTRFAALQTEYLGQLGRIFSSPQPPTASDRRFADESWRDGPFAWGAALYSLNAEYLQKMAEAVQGDARTRDRIRFATQQWVDLMSPANFLLTNPEAQRKLLETKGESLWTGIQNMLGDLQKGRISQTDESAFEVGRNVATSAGHVVFENELIQIIQYTPSTPRVGSRPLLMVPPCINKFYILDLQPDNSLVAYAVAQGHTVFMVSWRNVQSEHSRLTWDDYLEQGVIAAIQTVREISGQPRINLLGFCVGGTLVATALAAIHARGERPVESLTLLTSLLDFSDPGVLGVFIDESFVAYKEATIGSGGLMPARDLAATFNFLRPNDLVWNYVVSNYLKGEAPPPFDLLYWNNDSTNLPGPMYCWYLRHMYLQNELRVPGRLVCAGVPIDLGAIDVPVYIYASREDHIVPWRTAFQSTRLLGGPARFVLGASGHIAGVINPAHRNKRNYWLGQSLPADADVWFEQADEIPGSWWPDWSRWLAGFQGDLVAAPRPGSKAHPVIEAAPGRYVREKA
jgi:polyhydroxyalkanoate synthase